ETRYPEAEKVSFTVEAARPVSFALRLRYPGWARSLTVAVNGRPQNIDAKPDNPKRVAIFYGPTLLAGELGAEGELNSASLIPALITSNSEPATWMRPVAERPVTFRTTNVGRPEDVTLYPFYAMHHKRYAVYWDLLTPER